MLGWIAVTSSWNQNSQDGPGRHPSRSAIQLENNKIQAVRTYSICTKTGCFRAVFALSCTGDTPAAAAALKVAPLKDSPFVNKTKGPRAPERAPPETVLGYGEPQEVFTLPGELLEVRV